MCTSCRSRHMAGSSELELHGPARRLFGIVVGLIGT
jgi:hypothetical protein